MEVITGLWRRQTEFQVNLKLGLTPGFSPRGSHQLGHRAEARGCFERAVRWLREQKSLPGQYTQELADFRAEAQAVLAGLTGELPADVFAPTP